ncbi:hypothetical protein [Streptomyces diacarni]|uniref:hypothetical protein n=1 Tax=Streptomyces diacarni TaxID=2800381 RepID=UPI0011C075B1|nr:hypothetical protein [Streptomyces diacarni]
MLGTILEITDKASAPVRVVVDLTQLTGVATLFTTARSTRAEQNRPARNGELAAGKFEVNDIKVERLTLDSVETDFRVTNTGVSTVSIHAIELKSVAVEIGAILFGRQRVSASYGVGLTSLQSVGASVKCDVAQEIAAGEVDRFAVSLRFPKWGSHTFLRFAIQPTLMTNFGPVAGPLLELA